MKFRQTLCHLILQNLLGGYINTMVMARLKTDENAEDGLVIRMSDQGMEAMMPGGRAKENAGLVFAAHAGVGPRLDAILKNGLVYEFVKGSNPSWIDLFDPKFVR